MAVRKTHSFMLSGDRACPGKHFADSSLFINIATVLHALEITPPRDENGEAIHISPKMTNNAMSSVLYSSSRQGRDALKLTLRYPEDCRCTVKPRSEKAKQLILGI